MPRPAPRADATTRPLASPAARAPSPVRPGVSPRTRAVAAAGDPPPSPTRVLLTNDDGPHSPFFDAFVAAVRRDLGWPVFVAPPADGQSFVSKAVGRGPVTLDRVAADRVHVSGPPATAVNIALHALAPDCDFCVSGPNVGHNAGRGSLLSSGTVGAALEAALAGRRAVALSFPFCTGHGGWTRAEVARAVGASVALVARLWAEWEDGVDVYNVNYPLDFDRESRESEGRGGGAGTCSDADGGDATPLPPLPVETTFVDPGAQYTSLYRPAPPHHPHDYEWGPSGLRVFEAASPAPGGDVAAIAAARVSVSPLRAAFAAGGTTAV